MTHSGSRTQSLGTERKYRPRPQSCATTYETDARHSPSGHRTQASCQAGTQFPSCSTSTARGSGKRLTSSPTTQTVGGQG
jgi:hypothetical protein